MFWNPFKKWKQVSNRIEDLANSLYRKGWIHKLEEVIVDQFLERQSQLFEPDHAVTYGLLDYRQTIKPRVAIVAAGTLQKP